MTEERCSLLIVDDDAANRAMLRHYLAPHGFDVTDAPDGPTALRLVLQERIDLVLLDVLMPGMSGLEVLQVLRRSFSVTELPVIMATAKDQGSDVVEALRAGANDYLTKPFDFPVVLARVQTQVALKQAVDRARRLDESLAQRNADLQEANLDLAQANRRMRENLEAAARVQEALLPHQLPKVAGLELAWHYRPSTELAGDLLNVVVVNEKLVWLYVFDVVDHGVKAALLAVMISRVLARLLPSAKGPVEVAAQLDREFPWDQETQQFFTLMLGALDPTSGEMRFVSAGHPGPLHSRRGEEARLLKCPGTPIGLGDGDHDERALTLGRGDRLYFYSDGLPDGLNAHCKAFGDERLRVAVQREAGAPLGEGVKRLVGDVEAWCAPGAPHDDISVLAIEMV